NTAVSPIRMQKLLNVRVLLKFSGPKERFNESFADDYIDLDEMIDEVDVLMLLRIQHERHDTNEGFSAEEYQKKYGLTLEREKRMKEKAIIMHPAPITTGVEIETALVECKRARIFKQTENAVFAR